MHHPKRLISHGRSIIQCSMSFLFLLAKQRSATSHKINWTLNHCIEFQIFVVYAEICLFSTVKFCRIQPHCPQNSPLSFIFYCITTMLKNERNLNRHGQTSKSLGRKDIKSFAIKLTPERQIISSAWRHQRLELISLLATIVEPTIKPKLPIKNSHPHPHSVCKSHNNKCINRSAGDTSERSPLAQPDK